MASVRRIALGYNGVYVVEGAGARVLVDAGPDYAGAFDAIEAALGGRTPDVVVATHAHIDHAGLGARWQARGAPVAIGAADVDGARHGQVGREPEFAALARFAAESGAPKEALREALASLEQRRAWMRITRAGEYPAATRAGRWPTGLRYVPFEPARALYDGDYLPAGLRVLSCPGHTPGNLVAFDEDEGWLFSGDQLLPDLTPIPPIQAHGPVSTSAGWRLRSLPAFVASLRRLRGLDATRCFPGHGEPFVGVTVAIDRNLASIEQRTERVAQVLRDSGPVTLFGLAEALYPRATRRRFWQIIATVQGHLDLLEESGRLDGAGGEFNLRV